MQTNQPVYCLTHTDTDGCASAAIVKTKYPQAEVFYMNYGKPFHIQLQPGSLVFITDFCFEPIGEMLNMVSQYQVVWIDHHRTAIDNMQKVGCNPPGLRRIDVAACALTWEYLYPDKPIPPVIKLLSDYDIWNLEENPDAEPFQCGVNMLDLRPYDSNMWIWEELLANGPMMERIMNDGRAAYTAVMTRNQLMAEEMVFKTTIAGARCLCANIGGVNSKFFHACDITDIDALVTFGFSGTTGKWRFSIYSTGKCNVGQIARKMGGGGHDGAAGWTASDLSFQLIELKDPSSLPIVPENLWPSILRDAKYSSAIVYINAMTSPDIGMYSCMFLTKFKDRSVLAINAPCYDQELAFRLYSKYNRLNAQGADFGQPIDGLVFFYMTKDQVWRIIYMSIDYNPKCRDRIVEDTKDWYEYDINVMVYTRFSQELPFLLTKFNRFGK